MIGEGAMLKRGLVGCGIVVVAASMGCRVAPPQVYSACCSTPSSFAGTGISCGVRGSSLSIRRWL